MKKLLSLTLALAMAFSICIFPAQAANVEKVYDNTEVETRAVYMSQKIDASTCQKIYDSMEYYTSWENDITELVVDILSKNSVGTLFVSAGILKKWNYNATKTIFGKGAKGNGCVIQYYDNGEISVVLN